MRLQSKRCRLRAWSTGGQIRQWNSGRRPRTQNDKPLRDKSLRHTPVDARRLKQQPLTPVTRVRIPYALPTPPQHPEAWLSPLLEVRGPLLSGRPFGAFNHCSIGSLSTRRFSVDAPASAAGGFRCRSSWGRLPMALGPACAHDRLRAEEVVLACPVSSPGQLSSSQRTSAFRRGSVARSLGRPAASLDSMIASRPRTRTFVPSSSTISLRPTRSS